MPFKVLTQSAASLARTGVLSFPKTQRTPIRTPGLVLPTARGAVPHLTPDHVAQLPPGSQAVHVAAEDFVERLPDQPPIFAYADKFGSARGFLATFMPEVEEKAPVIASVRGSTPKRLTSSNTDKLLTIRTAEGSRDLPIEKYFEFVTKLKPDLVLAALDSPQTAPDTRPGGNRVRKMLFRTERWMENLEQVLAKEEDKLLVFAPVLPGVDLRTQSAYLDFVASKKETSAVTGLSLWNDTGNELEKKQGPETWANLHAALKTRGLDSLPRYNFSGEVHTPTDILELVSTGGTDLFNCGLVTEMTDAGIALDFVFPAPNPAKIIVRPVYGFNMYDPFFKTDLTKLGANTPDYIAPHHRSYIYHLIDAREMTARVLLQQHNMNVLLAFFDGIRQAIEAGTFEAERDRFVDMYKSAPDLLELRDQCLTAMPAHKGFSKD